MFSVNAVLGEEILRLIKILDRLVFGRILFFIIVHFTEMDAVFQKMGEGGLGEQDATSIFQLFSVASFRDDALAVEILNQEAEGFRVQLELENGADSFGFLGINDELFVPGTIAKRRSSPAIGPARALRAI